MANWLALLFLLLLHIAGSTWFALNLPFPTTVDELEHLSVIRDLESDPRIFPDYTRLRILNPDLSAFSATPNYLPHPSPYYLAMAAFDLPAAAPEVAVRRLRLVNTAISALAMAIMLLAGAASLPDARSRFVFGLLLVLFPKTVVLGGMINNDNLALLATAIVFAGLLRYMRTGDGWGAGLVGLGLALAGWTKLNVAVILGFCAAFSILLAMLQRPQRPQLTIGKIALALVIAGVGAVPTLQNLAALGQPVFLSPTAFAVPIAERPDLSLLGYFWLFLQQMAIKWAGSETGIPAQMFVPIVILALAGIAAWLGLRKIFKSGGINTSETVAVAFVLAIVPSLLLHAIFGYQAFKAIGDLTKAQTRYYYALWPGISLALAWLFANAPAGRLRALVAVEVIVLMVICSIFFNIFIILLQGGPIQFR